MKHTAAIALTLCLILPTTACSRKVGGSKLDALKQRVEELERQNRRLDAERGELAAKVSELTHALDAASGSSSGAVVAALPRCAGVEFSRLTALVDRDGTPGFEGVDVYLRPIDGRQRFVQVAGTLRVQLLVYPPADAADATPQIVGEVILDPEGLREAYRSGITGTHYAVLVPLEPPLASQGPVEGVVEIVAQFDDAVTGIRHRTVRRLDPAS